MVMRGNCTFYEKVRLAQINGAKGLLIVSKDRLVILLTTILFCIIFLLYFSQLLVSGVILLKG